MLIRVMYQDFTYDFIKRHRLDEFLETGRIALFRRSSGWVLVGIDPIRKKTSRAHLNRRTDRRRAEDA